MIVELNPEYTFITFVTGPSNNLALWKAQEVVEKPGIRNPLYIYGGPGLGKTHLLHAIGQEAQSRGSLVRYLTAQQSVHRVSRFIPNYLLFDDIDDLDGTKEAQERFFHWFNTLYTNECQIVITGNRHPLSMPLLDDRLRNRLQGGSVAQITSPDLETCLGILQAKANAHRVALDPVALDLIAHRVTTSIRQLEEQLNFVVYYWKTPQEGQISYEDAREALRVLDIKTGRHILPETIIRAVAAEFGIAIADMRGPHRDEDTVIARHVAMFLMRDATDLSLADIGRELGGRDHSTASNALVRIQERLKYNPRLDRRVQRVRANVYRSAEEQGDN